MIDAILIRDGEAGFDELLAFVKEDGSDVTGSDYGNSINLRAEVGGDPDITSADVLLDNDGTVRCVIETLEGTMTARAGDYLIRGVNRELYPCKPDIFAKTYDLVELSTEGA